MEKSTSKQRTSRTKTKSGSTKNTASRADRKSEPGAADSAWDSRMLGADERYVKVSTQGTGERLDQSLGLIMVSMRLPKESVQKFKAMAKKQGLGYQPFIRQLLMNYLESKE